MIWLLALSNIFQRPLPWQLQIRRSMSLLPASDAYRWTSSPWGRSRWSSELQLFNKLSGATMRKGPPMPLLFSRARKPTTWTCSQGFDRKFLLSSQCSYVTREHRWERVRYKSHSCSNYKNDIVNSDSCTWRSLSSSSDTIPLRPLRYICPSHFTPSSWWLRSSPWSEGNKSCNGT
jgi:hypothetical protein